LKLKFEEFRTSWSRAKIFPSECPFMRFQASLISTLVNNETTFKPLSPMTADLHILNLKEKLQDIPPWCT
jgi:hypothetical protein